MKSEFPKHKSWCERTFHTVKVEDRIELVILMAYIMNTPLIIFYITFLLVMFYKFIQDKLRNPLHPSSYTNFDNLKLYIYDNDM